MSEHTAVHGSCGCSVILRKTCDCPNAAQVDVTQCPMHEAAPDLLAMLKDLLQYLDVADEWDKGEVWVRLPDEVLVVKREAVVAAIKKAER